MHKSKCIKLHTSSSDFSYMVPVFFFVPSLLPTFFLISQLPHQADEAPHSLLRHQDDRRPAPAGAGPHAHRGPAIVLGPERRLLERVQDPATLRQLDDRRVRQRRARALVPVPGDRRAHQDAADPDDGAGE